MDDKVEDSFEVEKSYYEKMIKSFESTKSYDFLLKAGKRYKEAIFQLCKRMIEKEGFPESFRKTLLYMI